MQRIIILITSITLIQISSYGQKTVFPFKNLLRGIDTLVFRGNPQTNRNAKYDTLFSEDITRLAKQEFINKIVNIENYGVTPQGSISLYKNGKRIALIGCWHITDTEYGVNISINEKFTHYGLSISKSTFDDIFIKQTQ